MKLVNLYSMMYFTVYTFKVSVMSAFLNLQLKPKIHHQIETVVAPVQNIKLFACSKDREVGNFIQSQAAKSKVSTCPRQVILSVGQV